MTGPWCYRTSVSERQARWKPGAWRLRAMDMTFWLPQAEVSLAQAEA